VPHLPAELPLVAKMTEFVVIISLMGTALKIDRKVGWWRWITTWGLLAIAMPLIAALWASGYALPLWPHVTPLARLPLRSTRSTCAPKVERD